VISQMKRAERSDNCDRHGLFVSEHYGVESREWWSTCPMCREEERLKRAEEEERIERERRVTRLRERARIPDRYRRKTLGDYQVSCDGERRALSVAQDYLENFPANYAAGRCLVFCGKLGTGKTLLSIAIANSLIKIERSVCHVTVGQLIRTIRAPWNDQNSRETVDDVLERFKRFDLLIVDEIGVQFGTDAELVQLAEVIDARYAAMKPTLVISNCTPGELNKFLGDRAVDRLRENGGKVVIFDWESHRGLNAS